jgi:hypothetical protein
MKLIFITSCRYQTLNIVIGCVVTVQYDKSVWISHDVKIPYIFLYGECVTKQKV